MNLKPLTDEIPFELVISEVGNAMLLHKGALHRTYSWAEYDSSTHNLKLITEEGELQDLGMKIHKPMQAPLAKTKELLLIEVNEDFSCKPPVFIKLAQIIN